MANNYCRSSSFIHIKPEQKEQTLEILAKIEAELLEDEDYGYAGFVAQFNDASDYGDSGLWIYEEESIVPEHLERLVKALVEELDLPGITTCSWSYTCSKPRVNEFSGGAFAITKGKDTIWVGDAYQAAKQLMENELKA